MALFSSLRRGGAVALGASAALFFPSLGAFAGTAVPDYATKVLSFTQGTGLPANYFNSASAALNLPAPVSGVGTPFPNVLDPFSPAFSKDQIVVLGKGGQITLQLKSAFSVRNTPQLGIVSNVGLVDTSYPGGHTGATASIFGGGVADVRISANDRTWFDLGNITFNIPASAFSKLSNPYEAAPSRTDVASNDGKPFVGKLSNFNNESFASVLKTLNGSVGGTWLNVYRSRLATVDYVQIRNPLGQPGTPGNPQRFALDALTIATTTPTGVPLVGGPTPGSSSVPLPPAAPVGAMTLLAIGGWRWGASRRRAGV